MSLSQRVCILLYSFKIMFSDKVILTKSGKDNLGPLGKFYLFAVTIILTFELSDVIFDKRVSFNHGMFVD